MQYCLYLRKSRSDLEAEQRGEAETLARHENTLLALAKQQGLAVTQIYREVVSGDTIAARPVMQQLLAEVEQGRWAGVLVMEVERLARGDTIDQGIMAQAFKYSGTKIYTPMKTYDPNNEFDEEYFEFGLFMSRREYKVINRRLQRGRAASVQEGKYVGALAPYGYKKVKLQGEKGFTLEPVEEQAAAVQLIYDWYVNGIGGERIGVSVIAKKLTSMGIRPLKKEYWSAATVRGILSNPVYIGKIRWMWRPVSNRVVDGQRVRHRPRAADYSLVDGRHPAIIDRALWERAQVLSRANSVGKRPAARQLQNPLAGLVVCSRCGNRLVRKVHRQARDSLACVTQGCPTASVVLADVESALLASLGDWLEAFLLENKEEPPQLGSINAKEAVLRQLSSQLADVETQKNNLHNLLEQGVYDTGTFFSRSEILEERRAGIQQTIRQLREEVIQDRRRCRYREQLAPEVIRILSAYHECETPAQKNVMLKQILEKVVYTRASAGRWSDAAFHLSIYPRLGTG